MKLAVLNFETGTLELFIVPNGMDCETFLFDEMNFKESQIEWMQVNAVLGMDDFISGNEYEL